jgi:hypothetical protein
MSAPDFDNHVYDMKFPGQHLATLLFMFKEFPMPGKVADPIRESIMAQMRQQNAALMQAAQATPVETSITAAVKTAVAAKKARKR